MKITLWNGNKFPLCMLLKKVMQCMSRTRICAMRYFTLLCNWNYCEFLDTSTSVINAFFADYGINSDM